MQLAVATGIPPSVWADEGGRAVATAVELLNRRGSRARNGTTQMSG